MKIKNKLTAGALAMIIAIMIFSVVSSSLVIYS